MNEKYNMTGRLFKNDRKRPDKQDADYRGDAQIDGREYWINAWIKDGERGKWMSLSLRPKDEKPAQSAPAEPGGGDTSDVPF